MNCAFFGHSDTPAEISDKLYDTMVHLINENESINFYVGTHGRFDSMVYSNLQKLSLIYPQIHYNVVLAYLTNPNDEIKYINSILPDGIENVYPRFRINFRNKWMVEKADCVVAYVRHNWGGAAKSVEMAQKKSKKIINLYSDAIANGD